jgi:hypothetical protein
MKRTPTLSDPRSISTDHRQDLHAANLIVAHATGHASAAPVELVGLAPADLHPIG